MPDWGIKNDLKNRVPSFQSGDVYETHIIIINIEGMGRLPSAIAERAKGQSENGFEIIGLRDLDYANDQTKLIQEFRSALKILKCDFTETIGLYFSIVTVDAWLLLFIEAVSNWSETSQKEVEEVIGNRLLESIRNPAMILSNIGSKKRRNHKKYSELQSLISEITREMIIKAYQSKQSPSFNKLWDKLTTFQL